MIGLADDRARLIAQKLNVLLANYQVFYINARGYHWNIKGEKFFELHAKFEELYSDLQMKNDEIAERILTLGHTPMHSYSDYLQQSTVKETENVSDGRVAVEGILSALRVVISLQRELLGVTADAGDEGTNALMSDYIRAQEKLMWMYSAYLA
jgi:starvation-inducible DNA-binding protein